MPLTREVLAKYKNDSFYETGTYIGEGIELAIQVGFAFIYTCELNKDLYDNYRPPNVKHLKRMLGPSTDFLKIYDYSRKHDRTTFWLDAHYIDPLNITDNPLIEELKIILPDFKTSDFILIDDMRCAGNGNFPSKQQIIDTLLMEKDKCFKAHYEDGFNKHSNEVYPNDIMVIRRTA